MAAFLKIRDRNDLYDDIKNVGRIGIPLLIFENEVMMIGANFDEIDKLLQE